MGCGSSREGRILVILRAVVGMRFNVELPLSERKFVVKEKIYKIRRYRGEF